MGRTIDEVIAELSPKRRAQVKAKSREFTAEMIAHAESLSMVRKAHDKTQEELAHTLGIKTNAITQLEKRTDMLLSTLRKYVRACGADLVLSVQTPEGHIFRLESLMELNSTSAGPLRPSVKPAIKKVPAVKLGVNGKKQKSSTSKVKRQPVHA